MRANIPIASAIASHHGRNFVLLPSLRLRALAVGLLFPVLLCAAGQSFAQQGRAKKVPIVNKMTAPFSRQAFSGIVQSLDLKSKVLNVNSASGNDAEIFPISKHERVETADGDRLSLNALKPGTTVLVYFEEKNGRRNVQSITVLAAGPRKEAKKKGSKPS